MYVGSRILYNVLYINTTSASACESPGAHLSLSLSVLTLASRTANLRSVVFLTGVGTCFTLFIRCVWH